MIKSQVNDTVHYSTFKLRVNLWLFLVKFLLEQNFEILVSMIRKWTNGKIIAGLFNRISLF